MKPASPSCRQKLGAEFLGTAVLLSAVVGSGLMAEKLSGGNEALALLCNASATAAILIVLITMLAPLSGAHLNPAVTSVFWLKGQISARLSLYYVLAQLLGAMAGVMIAHFMFDFPLIQAASKLRGGVHQCFSEGIATAGLILTIVICGRFKPSAIATCVGLYIFAAYWFTASTSFANPAVTVARAFTNSFTGIEMSDVAPFIVAQLMGAVLAWGASNALLVSSPQEPDGIIAK